MSVKSISSNTSLAPSFPPFSVKTYLLLYQCLNSTSGSLTVTTYSITGNIVSSPLSIFILFQGLQQWHNGKTISYSDHYMYNLILAELLSVIGLTLASLGIHSDTSGMVFGGSSTCMVSLAGQMLFPILTCLDRYLAVVHPVTYLDMKRPKWIRIRNVSTLCIWLLCIQGTSLLAYNDKNLYDIMCYCLFSLSITIVSFFSLSVLFVLYGPGPGAQNGKRERVSKSKQNAFYSILGIQSVLMFKFVGSLFTTALYASPHLGMNERCALWLSITWFNLPCSLVLSILFLRNKRQLCFKSDNKSGSGCI